MSKSDKPTYGLWFTRRVPFSHFFFRPPTPPPLLAIHRTAPRVRLYGQQIRGDNSIGGWGKTFLVPEEAASQTWNGSFTEFILSECVGLIDRPTALKGADGKWEGVVMNGTGGNKAMLGTIRPVESPQRDAGGQQMTCTREGEVRTCGIGVRNHHLVK